MNGKFETVSDLSVVDKSSRILEDKNIYIIEESQGPCSHLVHLISRSIGNSVDEPVIPDLTLAAVRVIRLKIISSMKSLSKKQVDIGVVMKIVT